MRIVSVVPSQTELLYHLGLQEEVVGITKFCIHPEKWFREKTRIGGTKTLHIEKIQSLRPDWVLANKEENIKEQIEACQQFAQVYVSDIQHLDHALTMIREVGELVGRKDAAAALIQDIERGFSALSQPSDSSLIRKRVAYLIWQNPIMTVGCDTFIHDMIQQNGWINVFAHHNRYPSIDETTLIQSAPDILMLSSEPFPFSDKHIAAFQSILPHTQIILVDGTYFSWYGSRLKDAVPYFNELKKMIIG